MSSTLVVMQPTFLPWAGYFNLMAQADDFVFLDDVQLEKQSWQTRNRLLMNGQVQWVGVPVRHEQLAQTIAETQVVDTARWREKLARGFAQNYGKHPHYAEAREVMDLLASHPATGLAELNEAVIRLVAERLGLSPRLHRASELNVEGVRSGRLIALCERLGAAEYLSPAGSADYLAEDRFAEHAPARLRFQDYTPRPYAQKGAREFVSHLSILDVAACLGWKGAREYVFSPPPAGEGGSGASPRRERVAPERRLSGATLSPSPSPVGGGEGVSKDSPNTADNSQE